MIRGRQAARASRAWPLVAVLAVLAASALTAEARAGADPGFLTSEDAMLTPVAPGVSVEPIITVGETLPSGYRFESIPDGISVQHLPGSRTQAFINHETSRVPFPFNPATGVGEADFTNAMVSRLTLNTSTGGVLAGRYVIPSEANYQRFCSNFIARKFHGFERPLLFTNEEATDFVNRTGNAWPAGPNAEQAGVVVAYDLRDDRYRTIYGMGRHNHENSVALPGYGHPVVLSGDDTFSAPSSQLYMYMASSAQAVWEDEGTLWAFKSDKPNINDYGDLAHSASVSGRFIRVPRSVAVGDQTALETWSNEHNVFQFIRLEDIAYDRRNPNVVYLADTGEPRALPGPGTARMTRGPSGTQGPFPNGRIFELVLDGDNPRKVRSLSILIDGDVIGDAGSGLVEFVHQPDNLETTSRSLLIQEDPGSHNQYAAGDPAGTTARIWRYDFQTGQLTVVARVDQSLDPAANQGAWESSGIVRARAFGPDAFLVDVQAHTLFVDREEHPGGVSLKREGGQLLLLHDPGA
jgi:hypothetical protein